MRPEIVGALERERPDWALVYGDTNSTLARARVAHVEAGEAPMRNVARVRRNSEQFGSLAIGQAGQRFRVSDPTLGQDPASLDRADLREHQEEIAHPRRPHIRGRLGEDLRQLDRAGREVFLQLRSRRPDLVCMLQGTQVLFTRSTRNRNARSSLAVCHAADSKSRTSGAARHARRGDLRCYEAVDPGSKERA